MTFELRALPFPEQAESGYWFVFFEDTLLVEINNDALTLDIPVTESLTQLEISPSNTIYLGRLDSIPCFAGDITTNSFDYKKYKLIGLRQLFGQIEDEMFWLAARANHLLNWNRNSQYCGRCGEKTLMKPGEHSKLCPYCRLSIYPKISPAVIVAITKGNKILLAKNALSKNHFYSVLAGFVEPGETLEECISREIKEEAGIEVKNITYFGSQPWPFPDSLMIGYTAEYAGGELILDEKELSDADWFGVNDLPQIPGKISVARKLIDWFIDKNKKSHT